MCIFSCYSENKSMELARAFNQIHFLRSSHCCYCGRLHCLLFPANACCDGLLHNHHSYPHCYYSHYDYCYCTFQSCYSYYSAILMCSEARTQSHCSRILPTYSYMESNFLLNCLSSYRSMLSLQSLHSSYCSSSCPIPSNSSPTYMYCGKCHSQSGKCYSQLCCTAESLL